MTDGGDRRAAREQARKARSRRGQAIAVISSVVVLGGLATAILTSSGWPDVRETFFSAESFRTNFPDILRGFWLDVKMFLAVEVIVLVFGLLIAVVRTTRNPALFPIRLLAAAYCDFFRGIPVILLVYLVGFGLPALNLSGVPSDPIILACLALSLAYSAYVAEVYRAGIKSIHPGQVDAALATGLTRLQALRHVVLPQAIRRVAAAAAERLHLAAERRRPGFRARHRRGFPDRPDRDRFPPSTTRRSWPPLRSICW